MRTKLFLDVRCLDFDECMVMSCLAIPLLLWVALDVGFVLLAAILVAYGEVSILSNVTQSFLTNPVFNYGDCK